MQVYVPFQSDRPFHSDTIVAFCNPAPPAVPRNGRNHLRFLHGARSVTCSEDPQIQVSTIAEETHDSTD